jgi:hypothetical protein
LRKPGGYLQITDPDAPLFERDTVTCAHCNGVWAIEPGSTPQGFCFMCAAPICNGCVAKQKCDPFEKKLERAEKNAALRASMG